MSVQNVSSPALRSRRPGGRAPGRHQRGATVVEMALLAPVFFLLMFAVIEMSLLFFTTLTMQYAVREGARYAVTGRTDDDPNTANQQRFLAVVQEIKNNSMGMYAQVNPVITVNNTTYSTSATYNAA